MSAIALAAAGSLDLRATASLILLFARIYERAILRIGPPVKRHRVLATHTPRTLPATTTSATDTADLGTAKPRLSSGMDLAPRVLAVVLLLSGAVIGSGKPDSIALVTGGLVLLIPEQTLKHLPRKLAR